MKGCFSKVKIRSELFVLVAGGVGGYKTCPERVWLKLKFSQIRIVALKDNDRRHHSVLRDKSLGRPVD